ncbi:732_t:CDS:2 [Entrophospora sp. SA101]|nr:732_t:CDS:2 [Entrophospora sp. SA101]CAJ0838239.1 10082_t:CDS:2 [Entrophospora sp. SA101]
MKKATSFKIISLLCLLVVIPTLTAPAETVIGIDLGTTYSCVGVYLNGRVEILANDQGNRITPSYVAFTNEERLIGDGAKNQAANNPENTIFGVKRLMGRRFSDKEVQSDIKYFPFKVIDKDGKPIISVMYKGSEKLFTPEEISAMILLKMKEIAESFLGNKVTHAVVTVPAYFNNAQRQATKDAGKIADLDVRIVSEPTAAAIAYGYSRSKGECKVLVYDLGGGTFDVSLLHIDDGVFKVLATAGDTHLGGEDFDNRVIKYFVELYKEKYNIDVTENLKAISRLKREVEKAKRMLSSQASVRIVIESFYDNKDFSEILTRAKFEDLNHDLFIKTLTPVEQVLEDANVKKSSVHDIVLVGGSTRILKVQQLLKEFFDGKKVIKTINPDEAVAYGAAIQGGILSGAEKVKNIILVNVCPLTLGIEITNNVMIAVIPRNHIIPTKKSKNFTTVADDQTILDFKVFEGERFSTNDNNFLGSFMLAGILPAPRHVPKIEVTFEIDVEGILKVSAVDVGTGNSESITITGDKRQLPIEEIERMIKEAKQFAIEDRIQKERIDAKNELDNYIYFIKGLLGKKFSHNDEKIIKDAIKKTRDWVDYFSNSATKEDFDKKSNELKAVLHSITTKMYSHDEL